MTPDEVAARLAALLDLPAQVAAGEAACDVPTGSWVAAATAVRDGLAPYFDVLLGVDLEADGFEVVLRLWSVQERHAVQLRTRCPREAPRVPSLSGVFPGAAWHEREAAEMLGISFDGHPGLEPLLLPPGFPGHPLRKDHVLVARVETPWPGAVEAGQSTPNPRRRPPGVPR